MNDKQPSVSKYVENAQQTKTLQAVGCSDLLASGLYKRIEWDECHACGSNDVWVLNFDDLPEDYIMDGAPAFCNECGDKGTCSADDESAFVIWHSNIG